MKITISDIIQKIRKNKMFFVPLVICLQRFMTQDLSHGHTDHMDFYR